LPGLIFFRLTASSRSSLLREQNLSQGPVLEA
jgi:hypothetical protein